VARDPALKPYRIFVYLIYGVVCAALVVQLLRSVVSDLYGHRPAAGAQESPTTCLEEMERLYGELSARAVQPAPRGLESGALSREWDAWSRRWETDIEGVSLRCRLDNPPDAASASLADALDGIEEIRRRLSRTGEDAAADARRVKEDFTAARKQLGLH
jgi:hypothetical protein